MQKEGLYGNVVGLRRGQDLLKIINQSMCTVVPSPGYAPKA